MPDVTNLDDLDATPHADLFPRSPPRTVRLSLDAGEGVPEHRHPGTSIVLHLLDGELEVTIGGDEYALEPDDVVRFSGDQDVSPRAVEDSTALLVFAPAEDVP